MRAYYGTQILRLSLLVETLEIEESLEYVHEEAVHFVPGNPPVYPSSKSLSSDVITFTLKSVFKFWTLT